MGCDGGRADLRGPGEIAPSTYYSAKARPPSARAVRDAKLAPVLKTLWEANYSVYGRRKLTTAAHNAGIDVGWDQVARIMRKLGIRGASRATKRFTTRADPGALRAPDLLHRDFTATHPDATWVSDFTYCSTWSGIVYVVVVVDVFSQRIVGWKAARTMHTSLVLDAMSMAAWTRRGTDLAGLICHSDAGSQYTSITYTTRLAEIGANASIGTVADSLRQASFSPKRVSEREDVCRVTCPPLMWTMDYEARTRSTIACRSMCA